MRRINPTTLSPFQDDAPKSIPTTFTEKELAKYRQWFRLMDADTTGTVDIGELSSILLSTGILSNQGQVKQFFGAADIDNSGGITFEEFLSVMENYAKAKKINVQKLNHVIKSGKLLSTDTLISQERRSVLMKHIVHNSTLRERQLDIAFNGAPVRGHGKKNFKKQLSIGSVIDRNEMDLEESSECLRGIGQIVSQVKHDMGIQMPPDCEEQKAQFSVLPSVASVLSPHALGLVDQKHWKHYSISNMSDAEVSECSDHFVFLLIVWIS